MAPFLVFLRHAPKAGVNVLIMWLEPAPKRPAQECGCGARRTAFHDEVLSIEEICGIAGIKRKRLETIEWREFAGCPLPAIAEHPDCTKRTDVVHGTLHGRGIPAREVKIPFPGEVFIVTPRIGAFGTTRLTVCSTVPLRFSR